MATGIDRLREFVASLYQKYGEPYLAPDGDPVTAVITHIAQLEQSRGVWRKNAEMNASVKRFSDQQSAS